MEKESLTQLATLSHPQRMGVYRLLMRRYPDEVPAGEISQALGLKPSTASVYLSALLDSGLAEQRREGTSLRYRADLDGVRGMIGFLVNDCCRGRADLCPDLGGPEPSPARKYNVLFICTGNSARSIFAEALLRRTAGDRFEVYSAGTRPYSELNPVVIEMLTAKGYDVAPLRAKHMSEFQGPDAPVMDFVFTVCDQAANEECPAWAGQPVSAHWGLPDPVKATGSEAERRLAFQETYGAMKRRIEAFAALPVERLDRISLQKAADEIGRTVPGSDSQ